MGFADFLHVRTSMFRGRADVPGYIRRNEYKKNLSDTQQAVSPEKGMTIDHSNEFVQSHFSDGFLMKYLNMIIYYKIR